MRYMLTRMRHMDIADGKIGGAPPLFYQFGRLISRTIVDDKPLEISASLLAQTFIDPTKRVRAIIGGREYRKGGRLPVGDGFERPCH